MHRDIKPENIVFDHKGYPHLTDFGIAKEYRFGDSVIDSSGTPGYMAPEVINNKPHEFCVDYFALGVITYELMLGKRPYVSKTRNEIKEEIFSTNIALKEEQLPRNWDISVIDFINSLLKRKKAQRLGYFGIKDIKDHPWLESVNWSQIRAMEYPSPFNLPIGDNFDVHYANKKDQIESMDKDYFLHKMNANHYFKDFYFDHTLIRKQTVPRTERTSNFEDRLTHYNNEKRNLESSERDREKKEKVNQIKVKIHKVKRRVIME